MNLSETEWHVLDLLLDAERPLPIANLVTAIGNPTAVADALEILRATGVADRTGTMVSVRPAPAQHKPQKHRAPTHSGTCATLEIGSHWLALGARTLAFAELRRTWQALSRHKPIDCLDRFGDREES